ncbi:PorT family protein [Marivirga sp. S37H4]|uniref:PorT family protein n=1 Tax=Marivirga aurantiaca TaxID=2802615 RepID=A0A934X113_9BACT|nr:porin family protein [Marivirga aurantiaca]MBK6266973.1 PorT family protein [Marivirga aurantiaca]
MNKKNKLLFVLFVLTMPTVMAQTTEKGELITVKGDTIEIYVINKSRATNSQKLTYRKYIRSKEKLTLEPEEITSFSSKINYFVSMDDPKKEGAKIILTKMSDGYVDLYSARDRYGDETFYISKNDDDLIELNKANFEQFIEDNFIVCQTSKMYRKPVYEAFYFENIISSYNACMEPEKYVYTNSEFKKSVSSGVKLGLNYSSIVVEDFKSENKFGYWGGGYLNTELSPVLSLQLELSYNKRRSETIDATFENNYIQVPILVQIKLNNVEMRPIINFGPTLNFITSYKRNYNIIEKRLNPFSFGYALSAGIPLKITNSKRFIFELRFDRILNFTDFTQGPADIVKNSSIQFSIGIPF